MRLIRLLAAAAIVAGSATAQTPPVLVVPDEPGGMVIEDAGCTVARWRKLIGLPAVAAEMIPHEPTRVIGPGDAVTRDYRPARLNVTIAEDGTIADMYCG